MNFEEFTNKAASAVRDYLQGEKEVTIEKVTKNNGLELTGLVIHDEECVAVPTIYLEHFYEEYREGSTFGCVMEDIIHIYEERSGIKMDISFFSDYEEMKNKVMFKLIHYERNISLLNEIPYIRWEDLAVVFYCILSNELLGTGTVLIRNEHMNDWGVSVEELYQAAMNNTSNQLDEELLSMQSLLAELDVYDLEADERLQHEFEEEKPLYVLTNKWKLFGAGTLLYSKKIRDLSERLGQDIYIIPSSVHELILIPCQGKEDVQYIKEMIWEVNRTQVAPDEILSDSLYCYDRGRDKIALMC